MVEQTLAGKVAIISGPCSGIDTEIARELSSRGAHVVINYPFPTLLEEDKAVCSSLKA